jgi:hypothetical protein
LSTVMPRARANCSSLAEAAAALAGITGLAAVDDGTIDHACTLSTAQLDAAAG